MAEPAVAAALAGAAVLGDPVAEVAGFAGAAVLLVVFTGAIVISLRRGDRTPCRCFGAGATPLGWPHVMRNAVLLIEPGAGEVVPPGSLLVVGDNPAHSHDSRHLGPIPVNRVIDRVVPSRPRAITVNATTGGMVSVTAKTESNVSSRAAAEISALDFVPFARACSPTSN